MKYEYMSINYQASRMVSTEYEISDSYPIQLFIRFALHAAVKLKEQDSMDNNLSLFACYKWGIDDGIAFRESQSVKSFPLCCSLMTKEIGEAIVLHAMGYSLFFWVSCPWTKRISCDVIDIK